MPHSVSHVWVHAVWTTKRRRSLITPALEKAIYSIIAEELRIMGCQLKIINGVEDHVHCLFRMCRTRTLAQIMKQIKGKSSYLTNKHHSEDRFEWQAGYAAFSVRKSQLRRVELYIANQKEHHRRNSFDMEIETLGPGHPLL